MASDSAAVVRVIYSFDTGVSEMGRRSEGKLNFGVFWVEGT